MTYQETLKEIRGKLRRFMNGVVSESMRRNGIHYKLNFGVALPQIREIAKEYTPDKKLAEILWKEEVRELKILGILLYPPAEFTLETARQWVAEIPYPEIAGQMSLYLLSQVPYAETAAVEWTGKPKSEFDTLTGFLLFSRLCTQGKRLSEESVDHLLQMARQTLDSGTFRTQQVALNALKRYGRQNKEQAQKVLNLLSDYVVSGDPVKTEIYNDLKFEFDYSL
ncbi:MAG: DNA alkylation repair protein [Tannerellaceae bacterium]|nr:DNA alkylation repair protein [Tannerellaceae bacterium]